MTSIAAIGQGLIIVTVLALCSGGEARAADRELSLKWAEMAPTVLGRRISTVLSDGTKLEGKVESVRSEGLVVNVKKTSDPARFAGSATVPRNLVSSLRLSKPGWKWRVIGPIVGFVGGFMLGAVIGDKVDPNGWIISDGAAIGAGAGALGGAGLGYLVGHFADRHTVIVRITD